MLQMILAGLSFVAQNVSNNLFSNHFPRSIYRLCLLNGMALTIGSLLLAILFQPASIPLGAMGLAALFGVLFAITISMISVTLSMGPLGMSNLIIDMSAVVSILFGILVWHEEITMMRGVSLLLLLIAVVIIALSSGKDSTPATRKWLLIALVTMLFNGSLSVVQKTAFGLYPGLSSTDFTFWSLLGGAAACLLAILVAKFGLKRCLEPNESIAKMLPYSAGIGLGTAWAYYFQNAALLLMPSIVVFPVVIGLNVVLLMLCSILFFKERLNLQRAIAFIIGTTGIMLMNF